MHAPLVFLICVRVHCSCTSILPLSALLFFFNDTATTEIYTLSLHDALPISLFALHAAARQNDAVDAYLLVLFASAITSYVLTPVVLKLSLRLGADSFRTTGVSTRSEEHTSELQSPDHLVCRLLLEKKKHLEAVLEAEHPPGPLAVPDQRVERREQRDAVPPAPPCRLCFKRGAIEPAPWPPSSLLVP